MNLNNRRIFISLIVILPFLLFWPWLLKGEVLYWGTLLFQFWPWHYLARISLLQGEWPLWNPLLGNGTPLLANQQTAIFYPLNLILLPFPTEHALTLNIILHLIVAGFTMYLYAQELKLSPFAAMVSALSYMFSGYIIGRTQFVTMVDAAAWYPLLLLLSERLITKPNYRNVIWLGLVLAVQLLAGHAQLWFYALCLITAYIIFRGWQENHQAAWSQLLKIQVQKLWFLGIAIGLAILLAAVQLIPTAEFAMQSPRGSGAERTFALTYSFWPWRLITLIAPNFFGHPAQDNYWGYANYWEDHAYLGILPFILALVAIGYHFKTFRAKKSTPIAQRVVPFFALLIPISLILAMGWNTPVYLWVFEYIPGFGLFQAPARLLIWYTVAVAVLAGVGIESFQLTAPNRRHWQRFLMACVGLTLAGAIGRIWLSGRNMTFLEATTSLGILAILSITILLFAPRTKSRAILWQGIVLLFITTDLFWVARPLLPTLPAYLFDPAVNSAITLKEQSNDYRYFIDKDFDYNLKFAHYFQFKSFGPQEVTHWQSLKETLTPNLGIFAQLPAVNNDDPLRVKRHEQIINLIQHSDPPQKAKLLALMNAAYFIQGADSSIWPIIYTNRSITIQEVPDPLPRAYFITQTYAVSTEAEAQERLTAPDFNPHQEVIIIRDTEDREQIPSSSPPQPPPEAIPITVNEISPTHLQLTVEAPTAGFVVLTDTFYPGWQAFVDGQQRSILPANLAFRAIPIKTGQHEIIFTYFPPTFTIGLWTSGATLLIIVIVTLLLKNR